MLSSRLFARVLAGGDAIRCTAQFTRIPAAYFTRHYYEGAVYAKCPWKIPSIRLTVAAASQTPSDVIKSSFITIYRLVSNVADAGRGGVGVDQPLATGRVWIFAWTCSQQHSRKLKLNWNRPAQPKFILIPRWPPPTRRAACRPSRRRRPFRAGSVTQSFRWQRGELFKLPLRFDDKGPRENCPTICISSLREFRRDPHTFKHYLPRLTVTNIRNRLSCWVNLLVCWRERNWRSWLLHRSYVAGCEQYPRSIKRWIVML